MRPLARVLLRSFACLTATLSSRIAHAQSCGSVLAPHTADTLARHYAPILEFGPSEHYFPTIPFFPAFDIAKSTSLDSNPLTNFGRVATITGGKASWDALDREYQDRVKLDTVSAPGSTQPNTDRVTAETPTYSAVFYRVRCLDVHAIKTLWTFLRNDPQGWKRLSLGSLYSHGLRSAEFAVIEYYLYYVRDRGLQGHPNDIERVFVFFPVASPRQDASSADARWLTDSLTRQLVVIVGSGHSETTPNNVLVLTGLEASNLSHPGVLVELGGHASAPDRDLNGRFDPGLDANWNIGEKMWGTRDVQAISGSGYLGNYQSWFTVPRDGKLSVNLKPAVPQTSTVLIEDSISLDKQYQELLRKQATVSGGVQGAPFFERERVQHAASIEEWEASRRHEHQYALVPVTPFQRLAEAVDSFAAARHSSDSVRAKYRAIAKADAAPDTSGAGQDVAFWRAAIRGLVNDSIAPLLGAQWGFQGFDGLNQEIEDSIIGRMVYWNQGLSYSEVSGRKHPVQIWRHPQYTGSPDAILKRSIYRPASTAIRNFGDILGLLTLSYDVFFGPGGQQVQLGMVIPTANVPVSVSGVLEPQIGLYGHRLFSPFPGNLSLALTYERKYRDAFSWYSRLAWVNNRSSLEGDPLASDATVGVGISVMPLYLFPEMLPGISEHLRLRGGLRFDVNHGEPRVSRIELQSVWYMR